MSSVNVQREGEVAGTDFCSEKAAVAFVRHTSNHRRVLLKSAARLLSFGVRVGSQQ